MSESHQRQMQVFGQNPTRVVDGYSEEFETSFLEHMKRSHRFSRIAATVVYNEYIADRHHVHMNSTQWATLTEFIKHLGKLGKLKVEETPKGWFITYIDRDSETLFKEKLKSKRIKADIADEEKLEKEIQRQIERAEQTVVVGPDNETGEKDETKSRLLEKNDGEGEIKIKMSLGKKNAEMIEKRESSRLLFDEEETNSGKRKREGENSNSTKNGSVLDEMMREEERLKERSNRKDYWLFEGIIVKVMSKGLMGKGYYKQKGVVRKVIDRYLAEIEMLENKHLLRVDQEELETVLPQIGGLVKIVNGAYRGENAKLVAIDTDKFCAKVVVEKGIYDGRVLKAVEYEDICKLA
ncbi:hypothetical protein ACP275_02G149200 [Erythranthe tilingii]